MGGPTGGVGMWRGAEHRRCRSSPRRSKARSAGMSTLQAQAPSGGRKSALPARCRARRRQTAALDDLILRDIIAAQPLDVPHLEGVQRNVVNGAGRLVDEVVVRFDVRVEDHLAFRKRELAQETL